MSDRNIAVWHVKGSRTLSIRRYKNFINALGRSAQRSIFAAPGTVYQICHFETGYVLGELKVRVSNKTELTMCEELTSYVENFAALVVKEQRL